MTDEQIMADLMKRRRMCSSEQQWRQTCLWTLIVRTTAETWTDGISPMWCLREEIKMEEQK